MTAPKHQNTELERTPTPTYWNQSYPLISREQKKLNKKKYIKQKNPRDNTAGYGLPDQLCS